jgi:type I restriction enzyme S subunit
MRWRSVTIDSLKANSRYSLVGGPFGSELTTRDYVEEGVPVIRGSNLPYDREFLDDGFVFVREEKADALISNTAYPGDLVFTQRGTLGQVGVIPAEAKFERYVISQSQMKLTVDPEKVISRYVYYFFRHPDTVQNIKNHGLTSGVPHINLGILKSFGMPLPSIPAQKEIVKVLSTYDDLIGNNRRRMALLEEAARQVYQDWFVRLRFPGYEHTRIVDGLPEGWERVCVPEIIDVNPRERVERGKEIWYVPMSSLSEVGMTVDSSGFEVRTEHTAAKFRKDDVLLARITPCLENGKTAFVHFLEENEVACGSTEFIVLRGKRVSPYFTYCLARSYDFRENAIKSMVGSSGRQRVQTSSFEKFVLGLPPCSLLRSFDETARGCIEQIANLTKQNQKLRTARDLLLPKLMSGEISV